MKINRPSRPPKTKPKQTQTKPKQTQSPKCPNVCKLTYNKGLQKKRRFPNPKKQTQNKPKQTQTKPNKAKQIEDPEGAHYFQFDSQCRRHQTFIHPAVCRRGAPISPALREAEFAAI